MLSSFSDRRRKKAAVNQFANLMEIADQIAHVDPRGLGPYVAAILRPLQAHQILAVAERDAHHAPPAIRDYDFFFGVISVSL